MVLSEGRPDYRLSSTALPFATIFESKPIAIAAGSSAISLTFAIMSLEIEAPLATFSLFTAGALFAFKSALPLLTSQESYLYHRLQAYIQRPAAPHNQAF